MGAFHSSSHTSTIVYAEANDLLEVYTSQMGAAGSDVYAYEGFSEFHVRPLGLLGTIAPHAQMTNLYSTSTAYNSCSQHGYGGTSKMADNCWRQFIEWDP